jgi:hypothetical protein
MVQLPIMCKLKCLNACEHDSGWTMVWGSQGVCKVINNRQMPLCLLLTCCHRKVAPKKNVNLLSSFGTLRRISGLNRQYSLVQCHFSLMTFMALMTLMTLMSQILVALILSCLKKMQSDIVPLCTKAFAAAPGRRQTQVCILSVYKPISHPWWETM